MKTPDNVDDLLDMKPIPPESGPVYANPRLSKSYLGTICGLYIAMIMALFSVWGAVLFGLYTKNVWLVWLFAPYASAALLGFANLAIYYIRKNYQQRSYPVIGAGIPVTEEQLHNHQVAQAEFERRNREAQAEIERKIGTCFTNEAGLVDGKFNQEKIKECMQCPIHMDCHLITQMRIMVKFYKRTKDGDDWKPETE